MHTHTTKSLPDSELLIEAELPWDAFLPYRAKTLQNLKKTVEVKGFRPGFAPEDVIVKHVGEATILQEAAKDAVAEVYGKIVTENKIKAIGYPSIQITKLAPGNALGFKATTSVFPEIKLPDYKKIAKDIFSKKETVAEVTEKEVTDAIDEIRLQIARAEHEHKHKTGEPHEHVENDKDLKLPPVTDEFVRLIGDFKDVADFNEKIKAGLVREKEREAKDKRRLALTEKLLKESDIVAPKVLIAHELEKIEARFRMDIERMGLKFEDYLKHIKKNAEDLEKEWTPDAKKRAQLQLLLSGISDAEKIVATPEEIKAETDQLMKDHKDAERARVADYVTLVLTNEKVFTFLESQK